MQKATSTPDVRMLTAETALLSAVLTCFLTIAEWGVVVNLRLRDINGMSTACLTIQVILGAFFAIVYVISSPWLCRGRWTPLPLLGFSLIVAVAFVLLLSEWWMPLDGVAHGYQMARQVSGQTP